MDFFLVLKPNFFKYSIATVSEDDDPWLNIIKMTRDKLVMTFFKQKV